MGIREGDSHAPESPALKPTRTGILQAIQIVVGSVLGSGFIPIAPATFGALLTLPLVWVLPKSVLVYGGVTLVLFFLGVWLATGLEQRWGHDARRITIDELVGMLVSFGYVPFGLIPAIVGFLLFRFFDIVKLPFVRWFERLPGGWGIVMDDVMAGVCTNVVMQVLFRLVFHVPGLKQWSMLNWS
jgi:phosphatidylglycerophosphatase A